MRAHTCNKADDGKPDYARLPSEDQMLTFLHAYLKEAGDGDEGVANAAELLELLEQVKLFLVLDHYYWGLWAVNMQASSLDPPIPYLTYSKIRLAQAQKIS